MGFPRPACARSTSLRAGPGRPASPWEPACPRAAKSPCLSPVFSRSPLPEDLVGFEGHHGGGVVWEEPRRVVVGRAHGRNPHIVLVAMARPLELPATRHGVAPRPQAIRRFGVQLDADSLSVAATRVELDADGGPGSLPGR